MISIVIPNFNGAGLLRENLPLVLDAARREGAVEVIVVDDASADGSVDVLEREFPSVRAIRLERNVGFGRACMAGARAAGGEIMVLLNTDVSVTPGFLAPLLEDLEREGTFAVSAVDTLSGSPEAPVEVRCPGFRKGYIRFDTRPPAGDPPFETLFAPAGYAAYRRDLFLELGGFDPLYEPFYWEDVDVCFRAWKRGWRSLVEPRSLVRHEHDRGSIVSEHGAERVRALNGRNGYLFLWKNVTSRRMFLLRHLLPTARRALTDWAVMDSRFYLTLGRALGRLRLALERRREERRRGRLTDEDVFERLGGTR
ncbi:MAG: glycosyltransferase family 2 protein [Planctomycetota bacterium]|jgi:GT2 family glycosyltransferase